MTRICIVDGYSTARYLVERLRERGVECVHLRSQADPPAVYVRSFNAANYVRDLEWIAASEDAVRALKEIDVDWVVAGTESGVCLAESLSHRLGLPGNRIELADARRDKFTMAKALRAAGLDAPESGLVGTPDAGVAWFADRSNRPVVVKPRSSAGSDQVRICRTAAEVADACRAVLDSRDFFGAANGTALVQELLRGEEFFVNTVSLDGVHKVAEMWRYYKKVAAGGHPLYDYEKPMTVADRVPATILDYVRRALTALGIENGAAHSEVMLTERGPVLIETGARLGGGMLPGVSEKYSGMSQVLLNTLSLTDRDAFDSFADSAVRWSGVVRYVALINDDDGVAGPGAWQDRLRSLPTFEGLASRIGPGAPLPRTRDLASAPGFVYLVSASEQDVIRDQERIRSMERDGIYLT
jgi:biotin carboxylase